MKHVAGWSGPRHVRTPPGTVRSAALRCGLNPQTLRGDRFTAIRAVAVGPAVEPLQAGFQLGHLVEVALFKRATKVREQPLRLLILKVCHLMRGGGGWLLLSLLGGVDLGAEGFYSYRDAAFAPIAATGNT